MNDKVLEGLKEAAECWRKAAIADIPAKIDMARDLNEYRMFSLNQLAKIVRLPARQISYRMSAQSGGGRFEPEALTILAIIRRKYIAKERIPQALLQTAVETDTSLSCVCKLTGIAYSTYYGEVQAKDRK